MELNLIVCVANNELIGNSNPTGNGLLWHIPEELEFFKQTTTGNICIFGANTAKVVPIKHMSKSRDIRIVEKEGDFESILEEFRYTDRKLFVCGGYGFYKSTLNSYNFDNLYISRITSNEIKIETATNPLYLNEVNHMELIKNGYKISHTLIKEKFIVDIYTNIKRGELKMCINRELINKKMTELPSIKSSNPKQTDNTIKINIDISIKDKEMSDELKHQIISNIEQSLCVIQRRSKK